MINVKNCRIPEVTFRVFRPNKNPEWLIKKKQRLEKKLNQE